jgi:putative endonuclease
MPPGSRTGPGRPCVGSSSHPSAAPSANDRRSRTAAGRDGEELAARLLAERGYEVLERNWRGGRGEIDLVCRHRDVLVFVEVRTTRTRAFGHPLESLRPDKLVRLRHAGRSWMAARGLRARAYRFDLVALELERDGRLLSMEIAEGIMS